MKKTITAITAALSMTCLAKTSIPGTADSIRDIRAGVPIVTNALVAMVSMTKPTGATITVEETDDAYIGNLICYPNRMNVVTNSPSELMDIDDGLQCYSIDDFRTWELYFGPEYRELIIVPQEHYITIRPADGVTINNSTNDLRITKVPALITSKQFLGKQVWMTIQYPEFNYLPVSLKSVEKVGDAIVLKGENLDRITKSKFHEERRVVSYITESNPGYTNTVDYYVAELDGETVLTNSLDYAGFAKQNSDVLVTTDVKEFGYEYVTTSFKWTGLTDLVKRDDSRAIVIVDEESGKKEVLEDETDSEP